MILASFQGYSDIRESRLLIFVGKNMGRRALEASSSEKSFCENKTVIIENIFRVSLIQNQREEHMLHLASEVRKI